MKHVGIINLEAVAKSNIVQLVHQVLTKKVVTNAIVQYGVGQVSITGQDVIVRMVFLVARTVRAQLVCVVLQDQAAHLIISATIYQPNMEVDA